MSTSQRAPVVNLAELITLQARERPRATAVVDVAAGTSLTWAELDRRCTTAASALTAYGLVAGQRVALFAANSAAWVVAWFGALRAGLVAVPIDRQASPDETVNVVSHSGARLLLTDIDAPAGLPDDVTVVPIGTDWDEATPVLSPRDPEALAVLLSTAGTSGSPRAAMLTHRALLAHCRQAADLGQLVADDVVACLLPLSHVFGLNAVVGNAAAVGARLVVLDGLVDDLPEIVRREGVTVLPLPPLALHVLLERGDLDGLRGLRMVLCGAAPLPLELAEEFTTRTGVPVEQGYGLTEAAPGVATTIATTTTIGTTTTATATATTGTTTIGTTDSAAGHQPGYVGRVIPGVDVRIGDGTDPGEPDRVWVRGANLFSGYWPDGADGPDADGWFDTGDIGYLADPDADAPALYLVDRSRELIIVNGFNVYPAEVEDVIGELAGVRSVAVVGRRDVGPGERVAAFVTGEVTEADVRQHCARRLARYKQPTVITLVDELPRGSTGKIRKGALRSMTTGSRTVETQLEEDPQ